MNKPLASAMFFLVASAAQAGEQDAYVGVAADAASTGAALAAPGIVEANPLGWATVPMRMALIEHAKTLPREDAQPVYDAAQASGWGAAANNVLVLVGVSNAAPFVGLLVGYVVWTSGEKEREFWRMCSAYRHEAPQTHCNFRPWGADEVARVAMEQHTLVH